MDADSSLILSERSVSLADSGDRDVIEISEEPAISNIFLTISNLILRSDGVDFERELTPLSGLDVIGNGLSFLVKRSPQRKSAYPASSPLFAYKISKAGLWSAGRTQGYTSIAKHQIRALVTECRVLTHPPLAHHENIVSLQRILWTPDPSDTTQTTVCLVLEHAQFSTLAHLQRYGSIHPVEFPIKKKLCLDVAEGLLALHSCGITHGDVKTENVLIFPHDKDKYVAKLSDFGCAVIKSPPGLETEDTTTRLVGYTPYFRAPEGGDALPSSQLHLTDVYSFGLLVWRVLADGNEPFSTFFDLPAETAARRATITQIQLLGDGLCAFVTASIENFVEPRTLSSEDRNHLIRLFLHTLALEPLARSLEVAAQELQESLDIVPTPRQYAVQPIQPLPSKFELLPRSVEFLAVLGAPLQRCFYQALEDMLAQYERPSAAGGHEDNTAIAYSTLYVMISCRLSGVGCQKDPTEAFRLLLKLTKLGGIPAMFASSIILSIRDALGGIITEDEASEALNATIIAAANEAVTARRWILDRIPDILKHPRYTTLRDRRLCELHGMAKNALEVQSQEGFQQHVERLKGDGRADEPIFGHGNTTLHAVALFGDVQMLQDLIHGHACSIDLQNGLGESSLLLASMHGRSKEALYLIEAGASINLSNGASLLDYLAIMRSEEIETITQALHDRGVRVRQAWCIGTYSMNNTYFFLDMIKGDAMLKAIGTNRLDVVKAIIALSEGRIPESFEERKRYFTYSIEAAAQLHTAEILEHLLTSLVGHDEPAERKSIGRAWHIGRGDSLVRYTVSAEYTTDRIAVHGSRFLTAAEEILRVLDDFGFIEPLLVFHSRTQSTLLCALETGNEEMATNLLSFDAIVAAIDTPDPGTGFTPLHSCIRHGARSTFGRLIELGAQYKQGISYPPGTAGTTSYLHVCASHRADVWFAERLMNAGVPPDVPDTHGSPPLLMALLRQSYDLARLLIRRGGGLNRILSTGYTVTGTLMIPTIREHFHDFLGAIEFILSLDNPQERPDFVVNPATQQTILHMAVNVDPEPLEKLKKEDGTHAAADKFDALTALVLKHFSEPDHVNARHVSGLTPLHVAIANKNFSAVRLLLDAGADVSISPGPGKSTLSMARSHVLLFGNQLFTPGQIPQPLQDLVKRSSAIASLIYRASSESEHVPMYSAILKLYEAIEPFIAQMRRLEHTSSKMLGLETIVLRIIGQHRPDTTGHDTKDTFEYQQLMNSLVQPWIMVEATIGFMPSSAPLVRDNDKRHDAQLSAAKNVQWLGEFSLIGIDHIQQAALFEVVLQALGDGHEISKRADPQMDRYMAYSKSRNSADLPESPMLARYPYPLKDIYERVLKLKCIEPYDTQGILRCLRYLDSGANPDRFSAADPPAMTKEEFQEFHLQILQGQELRLEDLRATLQVRAKCGCHNHKIRKITLPRLELLTQSMRAMSNTSSERAVETPVAPSDNSESATVSDTALETRQQPYKEFDIGDLRESLPTVGSSLGVHNDGPVEHFGIFCAGVACANKVWSHSFIRGDRARCLPCQTASFCESCMESHAHPRLYVHGVAVERNSQISEREYEKMKAAGRFVEQTVWESGWLDESGQLTFDGELVPSGSPYPVTHYGFRCDGTACAEKDYANPFIKGVRYHCETCLDADFCTTCEPAHDQTHPRVRIGESRMTKEQFELAFPTEPAQEQGTEPHGRDELVHEMLHWTRIDYWEN